MKVRTDGETTMSQGDLRVRFNLVDRVDREFVSSTRPGTQPFQCLDSVRRGYGDRVGIVVRKSFKVLTGST